MNVICRLIIHSNFVLGRIHHLSITPASQPFPVSFCRDFGLTLSHLPLWTLDKSSLEHRLWFQLLQRHKAAPSTSHQWEQRKVIIDHWEEWGWQKGGWGGMSWPEGGKNRRAQAAVGSAAAQASTGDRTLGLIWGSQQLQGALQPAQEQEFAFLHIQELQGRAWKPGT